MKCLESIMSQKEIEAMKEFKRTHRCQQGEAKTAIGGRWEYRIVPTSIGVAISTIRVGDEHQD